MIYKLNIQQTVGGIVIIFDQLIPTKHIFKFLPVLFHLAVGCTPHKNAGASGLKDATVALQPGEAYDSLRIRFTDNTCVTFNHSEQSVSEKQAFMQKVDEQSDLFKSVGYEVDGSFTYGLAKGDAKATMLEEGRSTERSIAFLSYMRVTSKISRVMNPTLIASFDRQRCGDQYVNSLSYGSELAVLVKLSFASEKYKQSFSASTGGNYAGLGDIRANFSTLDEETKKYTSVTIKYTSVGESLSDVVKIFNGADAITCSLENFAACENMLISIVDYQNSKFVQSASTSQSVIRYSLAPYQGINFEIDPAIKAQRIALQKLLEDQVQDGNRAADLANSVLLSQTDRESLQLMGRVIARNVVIIKDAIIDCFDHPDHCAAVPTLADYDKNSLSSRTVIKDVAVDAAVSGVTSCSSTIYDEVKNSCNEAAKKMPGEVVSIDVHYGSVSLHEDDDIFKGRSCSASAGGSQCHVSLRI